MKPSEKEVKFVMTAGFANHYGPIEPLMYIGIAKKVWASMPFDMLVFENEKKGFLKVSVTGYNVDTNEDQPENKQIMRVKSLDIKKFWLKYDDYGDYWIGTFLFPEEY
jgi:hypothetical protein